MNGFVQRVLQTVQRHELIPGGARVVVAVSGGPDSVALLRALHALRSRLRFGLEVASVDHGTRPESADDVAFVAALARTLSLPFHALAVCVPQPSEAALRTGRYAALDSLLTAPTDRLATGHTRSDQAETVLHRLGRGAGLRGASGIPLRRDRIVRPLLEVSRAQVLDYLRALGQPYAVDATNFLLEPTRNRLRHRVLPALRDAVGDAADAHLAAFAERLRSDADLLDAMAQAHLARHGLALVPLQALEPALLAAVLHLVAPGNPTAERLAAVAVAVARGAGCVQLEGGAIHVDRVLRIMSTPST